MQLGDSAKRVHVPVLGCRGPAPHRGPVNRTRRGKGRRAERVPRSRQVPGVQPVRRFLAGTHGRASSARVRRTRTAPRVGSPPRDLCRPPEPTPRTRSESRAGPAAGRSHQLPIVCPRDRGALTCGFTARHGGGSDDRQRASRERPSPRSLRSSSLSSATSSQAPAASIALPAAATARHCAPSPARRGHMLRPRLASAARTRARPSRGPPSSDGAPRAVPHLG